jgi:hypothetical protein
MVDRLGMQYIDLRLTASAIIVIAAMMVATFITVREPGYPEYAAWAKSEQKNVDRYAAFLKANGVEAVFPLSQLLISARDIAKCPSLRFQVPPQATWEKVLPTLRLVKKLKESGIIVAQRVWFSQPVPPKPLATTRF